MYEATIQVNTIDKEGKKFDKVSRVDFSSIQRSLELTLDVHFELFPMRVGQRFNFALLRTLRRDGKMEAKAYTNKQLENSYADDYDYVTHGVVFEIKSDEKKGNEVTEIYASFGGLLMCLKGNDARTLSNIQRDGRIYLCLKRIH